MVCLRRTGLAIAAIFVAAAAWSPTLSAQEMKEGTWTGSIMTPDGPFDLEFDVTGSGEDLAITMTVIEAGESMPFDSVELNGDMLTLGFVLPAVTVTCELAANDEGGYEGECLGSDGQGGHMTMVPPGDG